MKRIIPTLLCFLSLSLYAQVGVGNTNPQAQLDISASNTTSPTNLDGILIPRVDNLPTIGSMTANQDGMLVFYTGSGNSGKGFYYWDNSLAAWQFIIGAKRINELVDGISDGSSVFLGLNSGVNDNGSGNGNTGVGTQSLQQNTSGSANTAIGQSSLSANTQGSANTAVGESSLSSNTTGSSNVAIGNTSLISNSTGASNIGIGLSALQNNDTGSSNIAIGSFAGRNTDADGNVIIGELALEQNASGNNNVAIGNGVGNQSYNASGSVFIGNQAGYNETNGNRLYISNYDADANNALIYGEFNNEILRTNGELQIGNPSGTGYAFPTTDGTANQVLATDGMGNLTFQTPSSTGNTLDQAYDEGGAGAGRIINATDGAIEIAGEDGILITGTHGSGSTITATGIGSRMFFNPRKSAFRAGRASVAGSWDDGNVGEYSFSGGINTIASGHASSSLGFAARSYGDVSFSTGFVTYANAYAQTTVGVYNHNTTAISSDTWEANDELFVVGNGRFAGSIQTSNALTIYKSGLMNINDEYNMPLTDGSANQIMATDGFGIVNFVDASSVFTDTNTTYDGTDFALSNQTLPAGQYVRGISATGTLIAGTDQDNQNLTNATLTGTTLNLGIEDGTGTSVNLASLQDGIGSDDQTLDLTGTILSIEDGNNVDLAVINTNNTLDEAYDEGGAGAGRTIMTDSGPLRLQGSSGLESFATSNTGLRGIYNDVEATGTNNSATGIDNFIDSEGGVNGVRNIFNSSSGNSTGFFNEFRNYNLAPGNVLFGLHNTHQSGDFSFGYGVKNSMAPAFTIDGNYSAFSAELQSSGTGTRKGLEVIMNGNALGAKFGVDIDIASNLPGPHRGLNVDVQSTTGYAAYLIGRTSLGIGTSSRYLMPETSGSINQVMAMTSGSQVGFVDATSLVGTNNTLDQAYDQGGAGAGRTIDASNGPIQIDQGTPTHADNANGLRVRSRSAGDFSAASISAINDVAVPTNPKALEVYASGTQGEVIAIDARIGTSSTSVGTTNNYGVKSEVIDNDSGSTTNNYGLYSNVSGGDSNYGILAFTDTGASNWAGYFGDPSATGASLTGNVYVKDILEVNRGLIYRPSGTATNIGDILQYSDTNGTLSAVDPSTLFTDSDTQNTLDAAYDEGGAGTGRIINATDGALRINGTDGFLVTGTFSTGNTIDTEVTGAGTRMFFNPRKSAFRAGTAVGNQWDDASIGNYSFATGQGTRASGTGSVAMGGTAVAEEDYSTAIGRSVAASGSHSTAIGRFVTARSYGEIALGIFNSTYTPASTTGFDGSDRIFSIGNGSSTSNRSNALTIYKNGLMNINDEYDMPLTDGSANQVMATDGSGVVSFVNPSTIFSDTDDQNIESLNFNSSTNILTVGIENGTSDTVDLSALDSNDWALTGNSGTNPTNNFIGTIDNQEVSFRVNNNQRMRLTAKGQLEMTNGSNSLFIGEQAGENDNLTDNRNTFIGYQNGFTSTGGEFNTSIGYQGMYNNNGGSYNMAVGNRSLYFNNSGNYNTGIGFRTLYNNTSGTHNIGIGVNALYNSQTNNNNISIGSYSLTDNTNGSDNVAIGFRAGDADTTSSQNVYIGTRSGAGGTTAETKSGNIFIGYRSGYNEAGSNKLYIENSDSSTPLLYGEFDNNILRANGELQVGVPTTGTGYAFPTTDGSNNQVLTTNGSGTVSWQTPTFGDILGVTAGAGITGGGTTGTVTVTAAANNGLNVDATADRIQWGGNLTEDTNINYGTHDTRFNLDGTGDFIIQDNGTGKFVVLDNGDSVMGGDQYWRDENTGGTIIAQMLDDGDDARFILRENGDINIDLDTNSGFTFNQQGFDRDFRVESAGNANMFRLDASTNRVGVGGFPGIDFHVFHGNSGTTSGMRLQNTNNANWIRMYVSSSSGDLRFFSTNQGTTSISNINDVSGVYTATSDRRLKEDFKGLYFSWENFMDLQPLTYKYKADDEAKNYIGMVAQDVEKIYPELISYHQEGDVYHMDYGATGVVAIKAVQELKKEVDTLKKENTILKEKLEKMSQLEARLSAIEKNINHAINHNVSANADE